LGKHPKRIAYTRKEKSNDICDNVLLHPNV